jgi:uncharacterized protein
MLDVEEQLARLRARIARIDNKYAAGPPPRRPAAPKACGEALTRFFIEEWSSGQVVETERGAHFETERLYPSHRRHGSADIGALAELPADVLATLSEERIRNCAPERWAFLDTETTGLAGGSGTYAFLIGVGRITPEGFRVRQYFMREYAEEASVLHSLEAHLAEFDVLITYNGKSYDQPLLETRYRMNRRPPPFSRLEHLDLLHGARRLWKLRMESCRLVQLEQEVLGMLREGDLPGELIPFVYFEFLRSGEAQRLVPIFHHNAMDILTLACLTAIVPAAFQSTDQDSLARVGVRRGEDLAGLGRWLESAGELERALDLFRRALAAGLPDRLLYGVLWRTALLEKRLKRQEAALAIFVELAGCTNEFRASALEELAKYYEHHEKNRTLALEFTEQALEIAPSDELEHRRARLLRKPARARSRRLL